MPLCPGAPTLHMIWASPLQDNVLGPAPATDVLLQLEIKMEEQVKAYLERMQEVRGTGVCLFQAAKLFNRRAITRGEFARVDVWQVFTY